MGLLETYFQELRDIRSSGAEMPEISYYTPLANLLNEVGKPLKPRVRVFYSLPTGVLGSRTVAYSPMNRWEGSIIASTC
jgi:hypothetical protein